MIWAQHKAYMDSCGMCMWADLVMAPLKAKSGDPKWLIAWDSCASHTTTSVLGKLASYDILVKQLPVNMTDILQVLDLVVNGPLKRCTRQQRARALYTYFQSWRLSAATATNAALKKYHALSAAAAKTQKPPPVLIAAALPPYDPPKPTMLDGLQCVSAAFKSFGLNKSFTEGIQRCFRSVGLAPLNADGAFVRYPDTHTAAKIPLALVDHQSTVAFTFGEVIDGFNFESPQPEEDPAAAEAAAGEGGTSGEGAGGSGGSAGGGGGGSGGSASEGGSGTGGGEVGGKEFVHGQVGWVEV